MFRSREIDATKDRKLNMNYWLFDLTVLLSIAAAILSVHGNFSSFFGNTRGENGICVTQEYGDQPQTPKNESTFQVGDIVEVYEPKLYPSFAFLAKIDRVLHVSDGDVPVSYNVRLGFGVAKGKGGAILKKISASAIRPVEPFEERTHAMCEDGRFHQSNLIPCTIDFHIPDSINFTARGPQQQEQEYPWFYSASISLNGEWKKKIMPASRIRRIVEEDISDKKSKNTTRSRSPEEENRQLNAPTVTTESSIKEQDIEKFPIGTVVEIHGPGGYFAFPATVTSFSNGKYDLNHGVSQTPMKNVGSQFVHPYEVYKEGTIASCNVGKLRNIIMVPCTVKSHRRDHDIVYEVVAKMGKTEALTTQFLPRMRVQRNTKDEPYTANRDR